MPDLLDPVRTITLGPSLVSMSTVAVMIMALSTPKWPLPQELQDGRADRLSTGQFATGAA
jgi:hypothetical protein